jgi:hypothetical protein
MTANILLSRSAPAELDRRKAPYTSPTSKLVRRLPLEPDRIDYEDCSLLAKLLSSIYLLSYSLFSHNKTIFSDRADLRTLLYIAAGRAAVEDAYRCLGSQLRLFCI